MDKIDIRDLIVRTLKENEFETTDQTGNNLIVVENYDFVNIAEKVVEFLPNFSSSLPKVCTGCGHLSTDKIDEQYLACCPENNYVSIKKYLKNSRYRDNWN